MAYFFDHGRRSRLAGILQGIGQISLASIAIPFFLNSYEPRLAVLGLAFAIAFWYAALVLSKEEL